MKKLVALMIVSLFIVGIAATAGQALTPVYKGVRAIGVVRPSDTTSILEAAISNIQATTNVSIGGFFAGTSIPACRAVKKSSPVPERKIKLDD